MMFRYMLCVQARHSRVHCDRCDSDTSATRLKIAFEGYLGMIACPADVPEMMTPFVLCDFDDGCCKSS